MLCDLIFMATELSTETMCGIWEKILSAYKGQIADIQRDYPEKKSLCIDYRIISESNLDIGEYLLTHPNNVICAGEKTLKEITGFDVHLRITNLPEKVSKINIRDLRSEHLGKFVAIEGLIRRATEVRPKLQDAAFQCARCGTVIKIPQEDMTLKEPLECYKEQGGCGKTAASTRFHLLTTKESVFIDTQKLEMQESPEGLRGGAQPQRLAAYAEDDIAGRINPGDRVVLNGILCSAQRRERGIKTTMFDIFLSINSIEIEEYEYEEISITPEQEEAITALSKDKGIYQKIISSIAPSIYGMETEKEALGLQLFGGISKIMGDKTKIRGDIHILLVGDPGTAKSQILTYITNLAPRGIYAAGKGASAAGLTAAVVREEFGEGRWTLEAGALVLADKGLACIDEIDKISEQDRSAIHEGMEQQTVSITKAGINATLHCRCALLGAANPIAGRFDEYRAIGEQINLPPALLSRFDLIFPITDKPNIKRDGEMAEHILKLHHGGEIHEYRKSKEISSETERYTAEDEEMFAKAVQPEIDPELLRKYIAYARRTYPVMTKEAEDALKEYYVRLRGQGIGSEGTTVAIPITPRQLEAFVRLSEASARIRLSEEITGEDAERAIRIMEHCLKAVGYDYETKRFDVDKWVTGTTTQQRGKVTTVIDIIRELSKDTEGALRQDIVTKASEAGISERMVEDTIERLKRDGRIYEQPLGRYKFV